MTAPTTKIPKAKAKAKARVCRFDLLKVTDSGIKPVCIDLNGDQALSLLDELKKSGQFIVKFGGFKTINVI